VQDVDDEYILEEMKDIGRLSPDRPPFKTALQCVKSMALHLGRNAKALQCLTVTNNFYFNDDSAAEDDDYVEQGSEPHPLLPILLARGSQLREVTLVKFEIEELKQALDVLDRSRLRTLRIRDGYSGDEEWLQIVVDFLKRGCPKLECFELSSYSAARDLRVIDELANSSGSLKYFCYGSDAYGIDEVDRLNARRFAEAFAKVAQKNKSTLEAIKIGGPADGDVVYAEFLGVPSLSSIKGAAELDNLDVICREKYCVPLSNLMWFLHLLFWPSIETFIYTLPQDTTQQALVKVLFDKLLTKPNKYNVRAIRNDLSYFSHRSSRMMESEACQALLVLMLARHFDQSRELGLLSKEYDPRTAVHAACRLFEHAVSPVLAASLHRAMEVNPDLLLYSIHGEGSFAAILSAKKEQGLAGTIDVNRKFCGHADPVFFRLLEDEDEDRVEDIRALATYPSFDPFQSSNANETCINRLLLLSSTPAGEKYLEIAGEIIQQSVNHPRWSEVLQTLQAAPGVARQMLTTPERSRILARLLASEWKIILTDEFLEHIFDFDRFDRLHNLLDAVAEGPMGLGKVTPKHKLEMADILWHYVFAWGDEENFGWIAKAVAREFPGSIPEWLAEFLDGSELPEDVDYEWDEESIRKTLLRIRI
jgi:hypothetical protein